jgi:xylulokinase
MYLGIDVGTSSVKVILIDAAHAVLDSESVALTVSRPQPGWSEQDPMHWWQASDQAVRTLAQRHPKEIAAVRGIGLSGQQHGATLLDASNGVIRPAILWNDARSFVECKEIEQRLPAARAISGNICLAGFTAPKLAWVKKHEPAHFAKVAKVLLPKDYVRLWMTGDHASDMSDSSGTYWLDIAKRDWSDDLLAATDLGREHMPALFEGSQATGRLRQEVADAWGMPLRPVVAGGGGDNPASACGIGAVTDEAAFLSVGTSGVFFVSNARFSPNADRAIHAFCHAVPNTWHQMGVHLSAAGSLEWLAGLLKRPVPELLKGVGDQLTGPASTLFLPYLSGERTPVADATVRGVFMGLAAETTETALTQAVIEGVAFSFRDSLDALRVAGSAVKEASVVGGGSRSEMWVQIMANTLNIPLTLHHGGELGGAFGAARLGLCAAENADPFVVCTKPPVAKVIEPNRSKTQAYTDAYGRYARMYAATKDVMG